MKSLVQYLIESSQEKKSFVFDFAKLENGEEQAKKLEGMDCATVEGTKVTVSACDSCDCDYSTLIDTLSSICDEASKSPKRASSEEYALNVKGLKAKLDELKAYVSPEESDDEDEDDDKKDEKDDEKDEDEKDDEEEHDDK